MKGYYGKSAAIALAVTAALGASSSAFGADPTQAELLEQIKELRAKVDALESKQGETTQRLDTREVDATVDSVIKDADDRSQFLQAQGFTAGYNKGKFIIQSEDGNFVLNPNLQFQFRFVANSREDAKHGDDDTVDTGFEVRRLKFSFDGKLYNQLDYKFQWSTSRTAGTPSLDEGYVRYRFKDTPWAIKAGSFVSDWDHETGISSKRQLAVERSFLHDAIAGGATGSENYLQGVQVQYDAGGALRASLAYTDGYSTRNTSFTDTGGGSAFLGITNQQWGVFTRVDYKLFGDWKQYDDFTTLKNTKDLLVIGAGAEYDGSPNVNALFHTVDVQWEPQALKGLGLYAAFVGLQRDFRDAGGADGTPYDWGFLVQGAYALTDKWEVFARYDYTGFDDEAPTPAGSIGAAAQITDQVHEITGGVNYYFDGHNAKFTADVTWLPNGSPVNLDAAGILAQPDDEDQFVFRAQFQLLL